MKSIQVQPFDLDMTTPLTQEEQQMYQFGVMKTIYVPPHPMVENTRIAVAGAMDKLLPMYSMPHLKAQDFMHREFFQRFIEWSRDAVDIVAEDYPYQYPTSGSSEAIRETIAQHGNQARARNESPRIHIFEGEYEGYIAYAKAHEVEVVVHNRQSYDYSMQDSFTHGDKFYMSTPSGIDGNIWDGYEKFLQYLEEHDLNSSLMIDLAYLNTTVETPEIRTQSSAIEAIFFSMSKSFPGTYYDRIGGVFSKSPIPGLYGNKWFKNLAGLFLGKTLMENSPLGEIPREMRPLQLQVVGQLRKTLGSEVAPSDVTFIATKPNPGEDMILSYEEQLLRAGRLRYCLTPALAKLMKEKNIPDPRTV